MSSTDEAPSPCVLSCIDGWCFRTVCLGQQSQGNIPNVACCNIALAFANYKFVIGLMRVLICTNLLLAFVVVQSVLVQRLKQIAHVCSYECSCCGIVSLLLWAFAFMIHCAVAHWSGQATCWNRMRFENAMYPLRICWIWKLRALRWTDLFISLPNFARLLGC